MCALYLVGELEGRREEGARSEVLHLLSYAAVMAGASMRSREREWGCAASVLRTLEEGGRGQGVRCSTRERERERKRERERGNDMKLRKWA